MTTFENFQQNNQTLLVSDDAASLDKYNVEKEVGWPSFAWLGFLAAVGSIGNALVLLVHGRMRRKSASTTYIMSLAGSDFVTAVFLIPSSIFMAVKRDCVHASITAAADRSRINSTSLVAFLENVNATLDANFNDASSSSCNSDVLIVYKTVYNYVLWTANYFSLMLLTTIAFDRFVAVARPHRFRHVHRAGSSKLGVGLTFVASLIFAIPFLLEGFIYRYSWERLEDRATFNKVVNTFIVVVDFIIISFVFAAIFLYALVFRGIYRYNQKADAPMSLRPAVGARGVGVGGACGGEIEELRGKSHRANEEVPRTTDSYVKAGSSPIVLPRGRFQGPTEEDATGTHENQQRHCTDAEAPKSGVSSPGACSGKALPAISRLDSAPTPGSTAPSSPAPRTRPSITDTAQVNTLATLILVTVVGVATWIPFVLQFHEFIDHNLPTRYSFYLASAVNPLIYSVFNTNFKTEAKALFSPCRF